MNIFIAIIGGLLGLVSGEKILNIHQRDLSLHKSVFSGSVSQQLLVFCMSVCLAAAFWMNTQLGLSKTHLVLVCVISFLLLLTAYYDLLLRLIPVKLLAVLFGVVLLSVGVWGFPFLLSQSLIGALAVGGVVLFLYFITSGKGIGEADVIMAFVLGMLFGWMKGLLVFSVANFIGLIVILPLMLVLGKEKTRMIPLVLFMVMAVFLEWYVGYTEQIMLFIGFS